MLNDKYKALITNQINAIARARHQIPAFHDAMAALERQGYTVGSTRMARYLKAKRVPCTRRKANWSAKTVDDRLFFRTDYEASYELGRRILHDVRAAGMIDLIAKWLKWMNERLPSRAETIDDALVAMRDWLRVESELIGPVIRQGRRFSHWDRDGE